LCTQKRGREKERILTRGEKEHRSVLPIQVEREDLLEKKRQINSLLVAGQYGAPWVVRGRWGGIYKARVLEERLLLKAEK